MSASQSPDALTRPWPVELVFKRAKRALRIAYDDGARFDIPFELLRVESPSAEVQGHSPNQKKLVAGKRKVQIIEAEPVGRYAVRLQFDDGHGSGLYSWDYLRTLGEEQDTLMSDYQARLKAAGLKR
ncbi:MAG: DUF971 domain-containing protein [Pseudomonadota bacterium]